MGMEQSTECQMFNCLDLGCRHEEGRIRSDSWASDFSKLWVGDGAIPREGHP